MYKLFFSLVITFALVACASLKASTIRSSLCHNDNIDDLRALPYQTLDRSDFLYVAEEQQEAALALIGNSGVLELSEEMTRRFGGEQRNDLAPYLIRACFFAIYEHSGFDPLYYPEKRVIVAYSFGLASRTAKPRPAALIFWSQAPVAEVRIAAGAAE